MKNHKIVLTSVATLLIVSGAFLPSAKPEATTKTVSTYAGSALMWSKNIVTFTYSGSSISKSSAIQNSGAIFPATMSQKGITKTQSSSSMHTYVGTYTGGGGIPTPWGNANLISQTRSLRTIVYGNGSYSGGWIK